MHLPGMPLLEQSHHPRWVRLRDFIYLKELFDSLFLFPLGYFVFDPNAVIITIFVVSAVKPGKAAKPSNAYERLPARKSRSS